MSGKQYKIAYLWYYVFNSIFIIIAVIIKAFNLNLPKMQDFMETGICCFGVTMLLSLWGHTSIVSDKYKSKYVLKSHPTKMFTFALVIIECMVLYYSSFNHLNFLLPSIISFGLWILGLLYAIFIGKKMLVHKKLENELS